MRVTYLMFAALLICGCSSMKGKECCKEEGEKDEVKMTMDTVPAAVRDGLNREAGGAKVEGVDKESRHGKTVYEADVMKDGKNWEIVVDDSGQLVSKKLDEEKDEHKGKGEKEEDEKNEKEGK